jgi:homocysteine S-methyltransferase
VPIIVYPNLGEEWDQTNKKWTPNRIFTKLLLIFLKILYFFFILHFFYILIENTLHFSDMAVSWVKEGCKLVGGCCRTTPEHIHEIYTKLGKLHTT